MKKSNVSKRVEAMLKTDANTRDSDKLLLLAYWEREVGLRLTADQRARFVDATPAESITRARRELKDRYPASRAVTESRYAKFTRFRQHYGKPVVVFKKDNRQGAPAQGALRLDS